MNSNQSKERNKAIVAKYKKGLTMRQLGEEYGCSYQNIQQLLARLRVKARPQGSRLHIISLSILKNLVRQGLTRNEAAEKLRVSTFWVFKKSKEHGLKFKSGYLLGKESPSWKGGRFTSLQGWPHPKPYVFIYHPGHPRGILANRNYIHEHILVMEKKLGRPLRKGERVYHINGKSDDNRACNLTVIQTGKGLSWKK